MNETDLCLSLRKEVYEEVIRSITGFQGVSVRYSNKGDMNSFMRLKYRKEADYFQEIIDIIKTAM